MPAGSKTDLPLAKAEPISNGGSASGVTELRRGEKNQEQLQPERGVRICERNSSPPWSRWRHLKEAVTPWEAHAGASSWPDLWPHGERSPRQSRFAGRTCDPVEDPTLEQFAPEGLHPMGETTLEQFVKDCSLWEGLTLEKFMEDCLP
ncbi:hypothetical protein GRJ2_001259800 [Grus japonensis]|uniref:Uncharacterized protein n=1 Tax=Grus japonensis TaxID=30415 RepID=A0ABC9WR73_GRUJA